MHQHATRDYVTFVERFVHIDTGRHAQYAPYTRHTIMGT